MTPPRTLVIGAGGFLGRYLVPMLQHYHPDTPTTTRSELDLGSPDPSVVARLASGCGHALLLAAVPQIDACEKDPAGTRRVNVDGTMRVAEHLVSLGVTPVFFSSDYVFKGDTGGYADDAPTEPTTEYGRQKVEVETRLRELGPERSLIIRLSKVYGLRKGDGTLLDGMAATLVNGGTLRAADDQRLCPTFVGNVVAIVDDLLHAKARGTVNVCADRTWSRWEIAVQVEDRLKQRGLCRGHVERTTMTELGLHGRPRDTSMRCSRLRTWSHIEFSAVEASAYLCARAWSSDG